MGLIALAFLVFFHILSSQLSKILKFLGSMWNPLSWVMEAAAIMAIALANGGVSVLFSSSMVFLSIAEKKKSDEMKGN